MSFSKSTSKRFIDPVSAAPPVGSYDVSKAKLKSQGAIVFEKDVRFKQPKDQTPGPADTQPGLEVRMGLNLSNVSFAAPSTPLKRKNRILSSSAQDLTSKDDLMKQIRHSDYKINELEKNLQRANKEKDVAIKSMKQLTKERDELLIKLSDPKEDEKEQLFRSKEEELNQIISGLQQEKINLECQKQSLEADLENAETNMAALKQQIENLETERDQMMLQAETLETTISQLQALLDQVRSEKMILEERLSALQSKNEEQHEACKRFQETLQEKESDLCSANKCMEEYKQRIEELETKSSDLTKLFESAHQENDSLKDNIFNLEKSNDYLAALNSSLSDDLSRVLNEKADLEEQLECLENSTTENLRCLTLKFETLETEHADTLKEFSEAEERLNSELHQTKISNYSIKEEYDGVKNAYKVLRDDYAAIMSEADDLESRCKKAEEMLLVAEGRIEEVNQLLESERSSSEKEKSSLKAEISKITEALEDEKAYARDREQELNELRRENERQTADEEILFRRIDKLNDKVEDYETKAKKAEEEFEAEICVKDEMMTKIKEELGKRIVETQTKLSKAEQIFQRRLEDEEAKYNLLLEENESVRSGSGVHELNGEVEFWRNKFEELQAKVKPFQAQLEQFENERLALVSENSHKEGEIAKLAGRYAQILGHQNNKQKIHHIVKIKEENLMLQKEVSKLRTKLAKEKSNQETPRKPRFDRSMAFQHSGKENQVPGK